MPTNRPLSSIRRRAALVTGAIAALAIATPVADASAAPSVTVPLPPIAGVPAYIEVPSSGLLAYAGQSIGNVFNGGTVVCVSTQPSACSVNTSP